MRALSLILLLAACSPTVEDGTDSDDTDVDTDTEPGPGPDVRDRGPARSVTDTGSTSVRDGCTLRWARYSPDGQRGEAVVILAHGFARSRAQMAGWGEHLSSWGAEVITPDLCFASFANTDHPANGRSLADLATELADGRPVILAGHSAGGLAATLAADELGDQVAGLLLFDPVDNDGLGAQASPVAPAGALLAEPSRCNADGNGADMVPSGALAFNIEDADHCSFEDPTDGVCTAICRRDPGDLDAIRSTILGMSAGFVRWHGGLDARGEAWWTPGSDEFESLQAGVTEQ